jgi:hypothetical protein
LKGFARLFHFFKNYNPFKRKKKSIVKAEKYENKHIQPLKIKKKIYRCFDIFDHNF